GKGNRDHQESGIHRQGWRRPDLRAPGRGLDPGQDRGTGIQGNMKRSTDPYVSFSSSAGSGPAICSTRLRTGGSFTGDKPFVSPPPPFNFPIITPTTSPSFYLPTTGIPPGKA